MLEKFKNWYCSNYDAITWFIVGFLVCDCLNNLAQGRLPNAIISGILAYANFYFVRK